MQITKFLFEELFMKESLGPTPASYQWVPGTVKPGVKRPEREAGNLLQSNAEIKNALSYTSTP